MLIRKIKMENFRGFRDKTIDFNNKSIVLLSAANGVGKTTTVDAIEWCLTGEIGRLKNAFDSRSTNATERKMNNNGILKNRDAREKEKVKVMLWLFNGDKEIMLCREQTNDELNPRASKVTIDQNEEIAEDFIREYVGESFYNFHFCDVQKSFNVQNKKRKDLKDFFQSLLQIMIDRSRLLIIWGFLLKTYNDTLMIRINRKYHRIKLRFTKNNWKKYVKMQSKLCIQRLLCIQVSR